MTLQQINDQEKVWLLQEKYHGIETPEYVQECKLIDAGMPVAYLIGNIEFLDCHIDLASKPLIPRAETEYWVDALIKKYKNKYSEAELRNIKVLDVFAGSGCIGIALKKHLGSQLDFAELKRKHCEQIRKNLEINFEDNISQVFQSDVLCDVPTKEYDLIVANPPYVPKVHRGTLVQDSVNKYEDPDAVYAGNNGNALIQSLVNSVRPFLSDDGSIHIEHDPSQTHTLMKYLSSTWTTQVIKDQFRRDRVLELRKKRH